ncbi:MAG: aryl-sulfate sulfotransferase [Deltaproteobacteria bacterium]|nr:aryl-sulfate sulfotransferase [Deltaproteobacteria bacterium]
MVAQHLKERGGARGSAQAVGRLVRVASLGAVGLVTTVGCSDDGVADLPALPAPALPTAAELSARNVSLSWAPDAWDGAEQLAVERRASGSDPVRLHALADGERLLDLGLEPSGDLEYRLCREGPGAAPGCSDWVGVTTPSSALGTEVEITVPYEDSEGADDVFLIGLVEFDNQASYGAVAAVDRQGRVLWELVDTVRGYMNDAELLDDGTLLYAQYAEVRLMSLFFEPIRRFVAADHPLISVPDPRFDEVTVTTDRYYHHEVDRHGDDSLLSIVFTTGHDDNTGWDVVGDGVALFDRDTGAESWFIDLFDTYDVPNHHCAPCLEELTFGLAHDWTHSNALWFDTEESQLYVNIRNLDRIAVFDYPSGNLVREIGDGGETFSHAHDPQYLDDGTILLFDNGLHRPGGEEYSRAVQFQEGTGGQLEVVWEYREDPDFYSDVMGDADRLDNGNTLITDAVNGRLVEVDAAGDKVWEAQLTGAGMRIYKTQRVPGPTFRAWCGLASP